MPPHFLDVVAPIATLGRGSPTGVVFYRHTKFPEKYRGGLFLLDWTFGQVHFVRLDRAGSGYRGTPTDDADAAHDVLLGPGYVDENEVSAVARDPIVWPAVVPDVR